MVKGLNATVDALRSERPSSEPVPNLGSASIALRVAR